MKPAAFRPRAKRPGWGAQPFASAAFDFALHWQGPRGPGPLPCSDDACTSRSYGEMLSCGLRPRRSGGRRPPAFPGPGGAGKRERGWGEAADHRTEAACAKAAALRHAGALTAEPERMVAARQCEPGREAQAASAPSGRAIGASEASDYILDIGTEFHQACHEKFGL